VRTDQNMRFDNFLLFNILLVMVFLKHSDGGATQNRRDLSAGDPKVVEGPKTIYFIRHAQSTWNEAKGKAGKGFLRKTWNSLKIFGPFSRFRDAPLTEQGRKQVEELSNWFWKSVCVNSGAGTTTGGTCKPGGALSCFAQNVWGSWEDSMTYAQRRTESSAEFFVFFFTF
jgi:hypothetical protein